MWWETLRLVWRDKWEAVLGIVGILMAVGTGVPPLVTVLSLVVTVLLLADLVQAVRRTSHVVREKHVPLVVVVGEGDDKYRTMVRDVLETVKRWGFREREFQSTFHIERGDRALRREQWLSPEQWAWEDLMARFRARVNRLEWLLPGQRVFRLFLNCPAALALGMGAVIRRMHKVVVYHWQNGIYTPVSVTPPRGRVAPPYRFIEVKEPEVLTAETYVSFHLADHDPRSNVQALADQEGCAAVHIRNTCDDVLPLDTDRVTAAYDVLLDADWTVVAREVAGVLRDLATRPEVKRLHLALSCPVPLALTIGMGLGTPSAITVYDWFREEQAYHPVLALDQLNGPG